MESVYSEENLDELIVLKEITELREENVKHFNLSNGINKAVLYPQPVHYMDENGNWIDIDNSLTLQGNEYSTNNKTKIKFANKSGSNGLLSIKDGDYKIDFTPLNTNKVNVVIENPQESNSRKFDDVKKLNGLISKATYSNIYDGIDIEYILTGNNIKENIIVNSKQDSYIYSFELKLNKLTAELSNGSIILSDSATGEKVYTIPVPYMVDANGTYSMDVEYSLEQTNKWKYTFTVTADAEWINTEDRAFPVTIDPTIISTGTTIFDTFVMENENMDNSNDTLMVLGNFMGDTIGVLKYKNPIQLENYQKLVSVKATMFCLVFEDFYNIGKDLVATAYKIDGNGIEDKNYAECDAIVQAGSYADHITINEAGAYEFEIKDEYEQELNAYLTSMEEDKEFNITLALRITNLSDSEYMTARITTTEYANSYVPPRLELTYINTVGVENYYGMLTVDIGEYGTGYINAYNRSLTYINKLTTIANGDYEISAIYNSIERKWYYSFQESITLYDEDGIIRYLWRDPDGTIHCFAPYLQKNFWGEYVYYEEARNETDLGFTSALYEVRNPVVFYPEDDIDYVLTKTITGELILKGYDGNQKMFDENGRLIKICDAQGNVLFFSYENGNLSCIDCVTADNIQIPQVEFTYNADNKLLTVYNFVTDLEVFLIWDNNVLSAIEYNDIDNTKDNTININYLENSTKIEKITDDLELKYMQYTFNEGGTVSSVQVYNDNNILQSQYNIAYNSDNTVCTDLGANLTSSADNVREKYTFDEKGRKITLSKSEGNSNTYTLVYSWTYNDDILPDDVYYTVSYSSNINKELDVVGNEASLVRYDINTKQETFMSISDLPSFSTDNTSMVNASLNRGVIVENIVLDDDNTLMPMDVIGEDTRQHISDEIVSQDPYNSICFLRSFYNGEPYRGTGFLIGPNVLLTAAHNVFSDNTSDRVTNPTFTESIHVYVAAQTSLNNAGQYVPESPYGVIEVEAFYLQQTYCNLSRNNSNDSFNYDWAICILETDIGNQVGWFDISITPNNINNSEICMIGYPGDKEKGEKYDMFLSIGSVVADDYVFSYDADTYAGNSGSPVFVNNGSFIVIGIHVKGFDETDDDTSNDFNGATKINSLICTVSTILKSSG